MRDEKKLFIVIIVFAIALAFFLDLVPFISFSTIGILPPNIPISSNEVNWGTDDIWGTEVTYNFQCVDERCDDKNVYLEILGNREVIGSVSTCASIEGTGALTEGKATFEYIKDPSFFKSEPSIAISNPCGGIDLTKEIEFGKFLKQVECVDSNDCRNFNSILNEVAICNENKCEFRDIDDITEEFLRTRDEELKNRIDEFEERKSKVWMWLILFFIVLAVFIGVLRKKKVKIKHLFRKRK